MTKLKAFTDDKLNVARMMIFLLDREKRETSITSIFSSPEHKELRVSYCDSAVSFVRHRSSVINFLPCIHLTGHIFSPLIMKLGQKVCLDDISDEIENRSCWVKN